MRKVKVFFETGIIGGRSLGEEDATYDVHENDGKSLIKLLPYKTVNEFNATLQKGESPRCVLKVLSIEEVKEKIIRCNECFCTITQKEKNLFLGFCEDCYE